MICLAMASSYSMAQDRPPRDGPPGGRPGAGDRGPGDRQGRPGGDRDGQDRPPPPPGEGPGWAPRNRDFTGPVGQIQLLRGYLELVDSYTKIARDPTTSGIAAVINANDILKPRGQEAVISYFTKTLPNVKNEAVQRAIRLQLIQAYKDSGQQDKALEQMDALITGAPAGAAPKASD
jgi:hypothetical protein